MRWISSMESSPRVLFVSHGEAKLHERINKETQQHDQGHIRRPNSIQTMLIYVARVPMPWRMATRLLSKRREKKWRAFCFFFVLAGNPMKHMLYHVCTETHVLLCFFILQWRRWASDTRKIPFHVQFLHSCTNASFHVS